MFLIQFEWRTTLTLLLSLLLLSLGQTPIQASKTAAELRAAERAARVSKREATRAARASDRAAAQATRASGRAAAQAVKAKDPYLLRGLQADHLKDAAKHGDSLVDSLARARSVQRELPRLNEAAKQMAPALREVVKRQRVANTYTQALSDIGTGALHSRETADLRKITNALTAASSKAQRELRAATQKYTRIADEHARRSGAVVDNITQIETFVHRKTGLLKNKHVIQDDAARANAQFSVAEIKRDMIRSARGHADEAGDAARGSGGGASPRGSEGGATSPTGSVASSVSASDVEGGSSVFLITGEEAMPVPRPLNSFTDTRFDPAEMAELERRLNLIRKP